MKGVWIKFLLMLFVFAAPFIYQLSIKQTGGYDLALLVYSMLGGSFTLYISKGVFDNWKFVQEKWWGLYVCKQGLMILVTGYYFLTLKVGLGYIEGTVTGFWFNLLFVFPFALMIIAVFYGLFFQKDKKKESD